MTENRPYPSVERVMEVTAFKDEETAKSAIRTLQWLDEGAPHTIAGMEGRIEFDMSTFRGRLYDERDNRCGTVCCIAGAMEAFKEGSLINVPICSIEGIHNFSEEDYEHPLTKLFFPRDNYPTRHGTIAVGAIKRKLPIQAADTLRRYLFTGEVIWND